MKRRRRGADLEKALLEAAWEELAERGYAGLTMEGVVTRAETSRPVLARRWDGKAQLAIAAIRHQMEKFPMNVPDRGDVRTELLEYLERSSERVSGIAAVFTLFSSEYFHQTSTTPQDLRDTLAGGNKDTLASILDRAVGRGEIDADKLIPAMATLLSDLFRGYASATFSSPPPALRTTWIDSIFLPLVRADQAL